MNYEQTIQFLFEQLPMYQKLGNKALKKDLTNISKLCNLLEDPQKKYPSIHIAGTNGKGTTAHMIAAVFQSAGFKVGLYTSPHYEDFRERIKIDGTYISEDAVISFVSRIKKELGHIPASFFEITVAMAFDYFANEHVDIAIIETGLGGRLDSTNIIDPVLSVITNISLDHQKVLGDNHYKIAFEKAGIIKEDRPIVIGRFQASCDHVFFKVAKENNAPLSYASLIWQSSKSSDGWTFRNTAESIEIKSDEYSPFYVENMTTAIQTLSIFNKLSTRVIKPNQMMEGLASYRKISNYKGRWQIVNDNPVIILDSAHNLEAIKLVLSHLDTYNVKSIHFVLGFVKDKDLQKILALFDPKHNYYFTSPSVPRGLPVTHLNNKAVELGIIGSIYQSVGEAVQQAYTAAKRDDLVFIGGSSFVVADALTYWSREINKNEAQ